LKHAWFKLKKQLVALMAEFVKLILVVFMQQDADNKNTVFDG
jgi:hypothetical protein